MYIMDKMLRTIRNSTFLKSGNNILHNRFILYFILFISILNLIGFTTSGNLLSPVIFILIGFLTTFFSKNMLVILMIPLLITNILNIGGVSDMEGMENEDDETNTEKKTIKDNLTDENIQEMKEKYSELFELQNTILDGMDKVTSSLSKAEPILDKLKEKFQS